MLLIDRLIRSFKRYSIPEILSRGARRLWRVAIPARHCFYVFKGCNKADMPDGLTLHEIKGNGEPDRLYIRQVEAEEGVSFTRNVLSRLQDSAQVYFVLREEQVVGYLSIKRGAAIEKWYCPIKPNDIVIYGVTVFAAYRGRGFAPAAYYSLARKHEGTGAVYIDAEYGNMPARRAIEKAGFELLGISRVAGWESARNPKDA